LYRIGYGVCKTEGASVCGAGHSHRRCYGLNAGEVVVAAPVVGYLWTIGGQGGNV